MVKIQDRDGLLFPPSEDGNSDHSRSYETRFGYRSQPNDGQRYGADTGVLPLVTVWVGGKQINKKRELVTSYNLMCSYMDTLEKEASNKSEETKNADKDQNAATVHRSRRYGPQEQMMT